MDSPLARVILTTISGFLVILLSISICDWFQEEYPQRPTEPTNLEHIQHQIHHQEAVNALQLFSELPETERNAIKESLESNLISMDQWLTYLRRYDYQIVCMGELHKESTRQFLAEEFFAKISADVLLLEATPKELKRLIERMETGRGYFPLLNADIMSILRTVKGKNSNIKIYGIEETDKQAEKQYAHSNSRDQSIAQNFWVTFEPGLRHIILFGALHCSNEPNWLFQNLCCKAPPTLRNGMLNVRVLGEHQNGPLEAFLYFLDKISVRRGHFVIPDSRSLHPRVYELFPVLDRQTLGKYRTLIVFRP